MPFVRRAKIHVFATDREKEGIFHSAVIVHDSNNRAANLAFLKCLKTPPKENAGAHHLHILTVSHPQDYRHIANALEASTNSIPLTPSALREKLLQLAEIEQRLGHLQKATTWLNRLDSTDPERTPQVLLLRGKIQSQLGNNVGPLRDTIASLRGTNLEISEDARLHMTSSLLWRLSLMEALSNDRNWDHSLQEQRELSSTPYLRTHNQQCTSMIGIFRSVASNGNTEQHRTTLSEAFHEYLQQPTFPFIEKCLASNLIFQGLIHHTNGNNLKKLQCLVVSRYLCERNRIDPQHEAVRETLRLLGPAKDEFLSILFGDMRVLISRHSYGPIINELYLDTYFRFSCEPNVGDTARAMLEEIN